MQASKIAKSVTAEPKTTPLNSESSKTPLNLPITKKDLKKANSVHNRKVKETSWVKKRARLLEEFTTLQSKRA